MSATPQPILCDGCGIAASPEHIRGRLARLEIATRFRPIHINVLIVTPAPDPGGDFYDASPRDAGSREMLLDALGIPAGTTESRLSEFQRRGFYFASASECPLREAVAAQSVAHLASTLMKRVQFSYKPKSVVLLSERLSPLVPMLAAAGQGIRLIPDGAPLIPPRGDDRDGETAFRAACARIAEIART